MIMTNVKGLQLFEILEYLYRLDMIIWEIYFPSIGEIGNKRIQGKYIWRLQKHTRNPWGIFLE